MTAVRAWRAMSIADEGDEVSDILTLRAETQPHAIFADGTEVSEVLLRIDFRPNTNRRIYTGFYASGIEVLHRETVIPAHTPTSLPVRVEVMRMLGMAVPMDGDLYRSVGDRGGVQLQLFALLAQSVSAQLSQAMMEHPGGAESALYSTLACPEPDPISLALALSGSVREWVVSEQT